MMNTINLNNQTIILTDKLNRIGVVVSDKRGHIMTKFSTSIDMMLDISDGCERLLSDSVKIFSVSSTGGIAPFKLTIKKVGDYEYICKFVNHKICKIGFIDDNALRHIIKAIEVATM